MNGQLFVDNTSTVTIRTNVSNYDGAMRYAKKSNKIAELVEKEKFAIKDVPTEDNVVDILTKELGTQTFEIYCS